MINEDSLQYKKLLNIGFSRKEALVYLAILELGQGTVSQIARIAGIHRTTGYDILDELVRKGIASVSGKEPKQEYAAESPDQLQELLAGELRKNQENLELVKSLVPELKSVHNVRGRPKVKFYEGTEGVKQVYEDTLTSRETIRAYANVNEMHAALPDYFPRYYQRRTNKGINIRAIIPSNKAGIDRAAKDKEEARESALVPDNKVYFVPEINIYDNKVMIA